MCTALTGPGELFQTYQFTITKQSNLSFKGLLSELDRLNFQVLFEDVTSAVTSLYYVCLKFSFTLGLAEDQTTYKYNVDISFTKTECCIIYGRAINE